MTLNKFHWISAAESCQIWDSSYNTIYKFTGNRGIFSDIAWSADGKNIALVQKDNADIIVSKFGTQIIQDSTTIPEVEPTTVAFSNEVLIAGTNKGTVVLWDYSKHKLIRKYSGTDSSSLSKVQLNNSVIAAGHSSGDILIYGTKTGQVTAHYAISNSMGLRDLKISTVKSSLLAAAFNKGTVAAWNTISKLGSTPMAEFIGVHQSPATCVALSPITDILMVSGGLDRNVVLYDLPKKKIIKKIEVDAPVTAIEFIPDGTSLMVGTSRGKVAVYDLRSIASPTQTIAAHTTAVNKIICRQQIHCQVKTDQGGGSGKFHPKMSVTPQVLPSKMVRPIKADNNDDITFQTPVCKSGNKPDLHRSASQGSIESVADTSKLAHKFPSMDSVNASRDTDHKNSSLFSPLKGEASGTLSSTSFTNSPILKYKTPEFQESQINSSNISSTSPAEKEDIPCRTTDSIVSIASSVTNEPEEPKQINESPRKEITPDFQAEFIRRIVHDVEQNLREVLRCRFGDLVIQSAQQFLTLQNELEQVKQQLEDRTRLEDEVRFLRDEVNRLRRLY